jgi:hypothetical protein
MTRKAEPGLAPNTPPEAAEAAGLAGDRRVALRRLGRFVAVSAPAITLLLAAGLKPKKAVAASL